jgi:hypothetical protein
MSNRKLIDRAQSEYERPGSTLMIGMLVAGFLIAVLVSATGQLSRNDPGLRLLPPLQITEAPHGNSSGS